MKLTDLNAYNPITIQCHDNPDADAIGSAYGLYCYFKHMGKNVCMIYSGRNKITKSNIKLMLEELGIPLEYVPPASEHSMDGLLIMVDCQYSAGNVTRFEAQQVAVIDHHPQETYNTDLVRIQSSLGSCATLVWNMLREVDYQGINDIKLGTALYYGLYTDTNQFAELFNPLDMDMCEELTVNKSLMSRLRNSNISLQELEIAGIALIRYNYNDDYRFAVIKANPCDPNILGLISDFLLQVAEVDTCLVYNESVDGYKMSVRSCIKEVKANELSDFLAEGIGTGGGHLEKAGGFISKRLYEKFYPTLHSEAYFNNRMTEYFDTFEIIYASHLEIELDEYMLYRRRKEPVCFFKASDFLKSTAKVSIRNQSGDIDLILRPDSYLTMERDGTIRSISPQRFHKYYSETADVEISEEYYEKLEDIPTVKDFSNGSSVPITEYARVCMPKDEFCIYAKELDRCVKLFPKWDDENYMVGMEGDYLAISADDLHNVFMELGTDFEKRFELVEE